MTRQELITQIHEKQSFLCIGLDPDINKIPQYLRRLKDPLFEFNKSIIHATAPFAVAYKPNFAFYESQGLAGWRSLAKTQEFIKTEYPELLTIADAKRGDIGNTAKEYAKSIFELLDFDAVTIAPYMGADSVTPFLGHKGKFAIVLGLTSNAGAMDFQYLRLAENRFLFEEVMMKIATWGTPDELMFVVGATRGEMLADARKAAPNHFFLVPGVGAQGGSLSDVVSHAATADVGVLVNSSRGIIYATGRSDFALSAGSAAKKIREEMRLSAIFNPPLFP
jgi:orotidine-5'-phosphate decarboxylase